MMMFSQAKTIYAVIAVAAIISGSAWAFGDTFGFRPALKFEVDEVRALAVAGATKLQWLEWENLKRTKAQRKLTPKECAEFIVLGKQIGVPSKC